MGLAEQSQANSNTTDMIVQFDSVAGASVTVEAIIAKTHLVDKD